MSTYVHCMLSAPVCPTQVMGNEEHSVQEVMSLNALWWVQAHRLLPVFDVLLAATLLNVPCNHRIV